MKTNETLKLIGEKEFLAKIYQFSSVNDIEGVICKKLKNENDTKIVRLLTMWKEWSVDLSSIRFRKALIKMDEYNNNTDIILQDEEGYLIKKLAITIS